MTQHASHCSMQNVENKVEFKNVVNVFDWAGYSSCFSEISRCDHELRNLLMFQGTNFYKHGLTLCRDITVWKVQEVIS